MVSHSHLLKIGTHVGRGLACAARRLLYFTPCRQHGLAKASRLRKGTRRLTGITVAGRAFQKHACNLCAQRRDAYTKFAVQVSPARLRRQSVYKINNETKAVHNCFGFGRQRGLDWGPLWPQACTSNPPGLEKRCGAHIAVPHTFANK